MAELLCWLFIEVLFIESSLVILLSVSEELQLINKPNTTVAVIVALLFVFILKFLIEEMILYGVTKI